MASGSTLFIIVSLLLAVGSADQCLHKGVAGLCVPPSSCEAAHHTPVPHPACKSVSQCCPRFQASPCKSSDGDAGRCLSESLCKQGGGVSPVKSTCGGPSTVKCCVYPRKPPTCGQRCFSSRGIGICRKPSVCKQMHGRFWGIRGCAGASGCCLHARRRPGKVPRLPTLPKQFKHRKRRGVHGLPKPGRHT